MTKKPAQPQKKPRKPGSGRRPGDPAAKRSYRFVSRMHHDLAEVLGALADEAELSRALFVERVLITFVNRDPRINLNEIGRKVPAPPGSDPAGSLQSFDRAWSDWERIRRDALDNKPSEPFAGIAIDEYGRDEKGRNVAGAVRPPIPDRLLPLHPGKNIRPSRQPRATDKK